MTALPSAPGVAARFCLIIDGLCRAIAARMVKNPAILPLLMLAWSRLGRAAARFTRLAARDAAAPRPRRPASRPRAAIPPGLRLPRGRAWLIRLVPDAASAASQLQSLLSEPEIAALLAASPGIGRILRPLCRALAASPTPPLPAPPPRRALPAAPSPTADATAAPGEAPAIRLRPPRRRPPPGLASFTLPKPARV